MENTDRDTTQNAAPQNESQDAGTNANASENQNSGNRSTEPSRYGTEANYDQRLNSTGSNDDPDEDEEEETEEEREERSKDWGHVDPAEGNSPFPDSNDPTAPGSAV
jgi:hypothetical protein